MSANSHRVLKLSRIILCTGLIFVLTAVAADARRHARHRGHGSSHQVIIDSVPPPATQRGDITAVVPRDWRKEPLEQSWNGVRFTSPAGDAWLTLYDKPAEERSLEQDLESFAHGEGEELTYVHYLQNQQDRRLAVSGFKAGNRDRIFYREIVSACGGNRWRNLSVEYPAARKGAFDPLTIDLSKALERSRDDPCPGATVGER